MGNGPRSAAIKYAYDRRGTGLCIHCGALVTGNPGNPVLDWSRCHDCVLRYRDEALERAASRLALGLCTDCELPTNDGKWKCWVCLALNKETQKNRQRELIARGLCCNCGQKTLVTASKCRECADKALVATRRWKAQHKR